MRVSQRHINDHIIIGRALADKTTVEAREPQLIKLPLPVPSVPVLTPLLSPLVGGTNSGHDSGSGSDTTTTAAAPPPATSTASSGNTDNSGGTTGGSSGGDSGGSTGGSSSGGAGGSSTGSSTGPSTGGGTSSTGGGSSSGDTSSSGGSSSGDTSSSGGSSSSGGTSASGDGSSSSGGDSSSGSSSSGGNSSSGSSSGSTSGDTSTTTGDGTTSAGSLSSPSQGNSGNSSSSSGSVLSGGSSANSTSTSGGSSSNLNGSGNGDSQTTPGSGGGSSSGGVANAGSLPGGGGTSGTHSADGKSTPNSTQSGGGAAGTGVGGISSGGSDGGSSGGKHGLSGGAIAGISILLLALLVGGVIFYVRRRTRSRRHEEANRWWFTSKRVSQTYGDRNSREILTAGGVRTARSSFATTVDRSDRSDRSHSPVPRDSMIIPPLPPMAEVGRPNGCVPALKIDISPFSSVHVVSDNRFSMESGNSENASEYLVVHHRDSLNPGTPMSVRPFSPSESFAFPKPPDPVGDRNSAYSRPSSSGTMAMLQAGSHFSFNSSSVPPTPYLPTLIVNQDNPINNVSDPFADNNPFEDPNAAAQSFYASNGEFAETEFICRPFIPTLPDELAVRPDDPVRILKTFDDGWALVEKIRPDDPKGKRKNDVAERGLIPIDCLRAPGQALPAFFAAKRVSSYAGSLAGVDFHAV